ncbi:MAG: ABC transporter permease, partial [Ktedonobacteraceae bacterium]
VGDSIRDGRLSPLLLRPFSPVLGTLVTEVGGKGVYLLFVGPVSAVLALFLHPAMHVTLPACLVFVLSLLLAWFLRFFWGYWIALLAFWVQRADIALAVQDACIFLLAGQVAPIALLPAPLRVWAQVLPFRSMLGFPVEVLTGHLSPTEIVLGLMLQICWSLVAGLLFLVMWRNGLRRYTAIGG